MTGLALATCMTNTGLLWAQAADEATKKQALDTFNEARRLQDQGRAAEACALFRRSAELVAGPGTLLNLAQCFEREGNALKALETYERALAAARQHPTATARQRTAWADEAQRGIESQRQRIAEVLIRTEASGLSVELDGKPVEPSTTYRVELGQHRITARAAGRLPFERELTAKPGETALIVIPELEPEGGRPPAGVGSANVAPAAAAPVEPPPVSTVGDEGPSAVPWVLVATGSALVGAGIVTGIVAANKEKELEEGCPRDRCPDEPGWQDKIDESQRWALITNVLWGAGLATAGVGVTWLLLRDDDGPAETGQTARLQAGCFGGSCGLQVRGAF
ncbi:MAG TPA: hypothetical protein VNN80_01680 [Polyangiaceae bacterium]|nr:hypothetical protein [Polyangiaceae bacterium]